MSKIKTLLQKINMQPYLFEKHPCKKLDQEIMIHYLNGLALMANADGNICEKDKKYFLLLMHSFGLHEELLEVFVNFAQNPDEELIRDIMESFTTKDIKYAFMMDCMMISHKDGSFDTVKEEIIKEFFEMFQITESQASNLKYLFHMFYTQNAKDLYLYSREDNSLIELFEYLIEYYNIYIDYELTEDKKKILEFEFFEPTFSAGKLGHDTKEIMTKPINNEQFCIFLNEAYKSKWININGKIIVLKSQPKKTVMDLSQSQIRFDKDADIFKIIALDKNADIFKIFAGKDYTLKATGMTTVLVEAFIGWLNGKQMSGYKYFATSLIDSDSISTYDSPLNLNNEFWIKESVDRDEISSTWVLGSREIRNSSIVEPNRLDKNYSFRLMRKSIAGDELIKKKP